jgi:hypothetical protein
MTGPQDTSRLALVVEGLRRPILLCAPRDKRRISPGLLEMAMASAMAEEEVKGGDNGVEEWAIEGPGSVIALGREDESCAMAKRPSGEVWTELLV